MIKMEKKVIKYDIPIQGQEQCDKYNKMGNETFGDFTPAKPTEEHIDILFQQLYEAIEKAGNEGGWYIGDGINVKIEVEYEPENK